VQVNVIVAMKEPKTQIQIIFIRQTDFVISAFQTKLPKFQVKKIVMNNVRTDSWILRGDALHLHAKISR
jgi:hypothetical protein